MPNTNFIDILERHRSGLNQKHSDPSSSIHQNKLEIAVRKRRFTLIWDFLSF
jgi:hypothetical protein